MYCFSCPGQCLFCVCSGKSPCSSGYMRYSSCGTLIARSAVSLDRIPDWSFLFPVFPSQSFLCWWNCNLRSCKYGFQVGDGFILELLKVFAFFSSCLSLHLPRAHPVHRTWDSCVFNLFHLSYLPTV